MGRRQVRSWGGRSKAELRERWGREDIYTYGTIDSTNDIARELAEEGAPEGTLVLARAQTAGRGRRGRSWHSPEGGGLYLSLVLRPRGGPEGSPMTILAGLGVVSELERRYPGLAPRLKWPNDIIVRDRKLGGILCESAGTPEGGGFLVVGVGINLVAEALPPELRDRAVALDEHVDGDIDALDLADAVLAGLERHLAGSVTSLDEELLDELDRLDWLKHRRVALTVAEDEEPLEGVAAGIAPDGALLLRPDRGALRRVTTGSVEALDMDAPA